MERIKTNFDSSNFVVSSLPSYVQENRDLIIKNFALVGTDTRKRIGLQTGIKTSGYLNYLAIAPVLQDGKGCGFSASGSATLTQRTVTTAIIKVNMDICPDSILGKYPEYLVRIGASAEELPFEQYVIDGLTRELNKKIEKLIWQGDHTKSSDTDLKWIDGFIYQFDNDSDVVDVAIANGTAAWNAVFAVYGAMTEEALERGGVIFVSPALYRSFVLGLMTANLFHYSAPDQAYPDEIFLPGTNVKLVKTPGLAGVDNKIVGTFAENLVYACDVEGDSEDIKLWFSDDDDLFKLKVKWNSGVAYHFPNQVVLGTIANS